MKRKEANLHFKFILSGLSLFLFFFIWWLISVNDPRGVLPTPQSIFLTMIRVISTNERDFTGHVFSDHLASSLFRVFYGFILAFVAAIPVGLLSGWSMFAESLSKPIVELLRPIPPFAWIPFAIIFFRDPFDSVFIVFLGVFFPLLLSTTAGVKAVETILIDAAKTLGARKSQLFSKVIIPASIPHIMTGIRIGLGIGWMTIVAAELVGVKGGGLGVYIHSMSDIGRFDNVFAGMFIIGIIGFLMVTTVTYIERRLSRWAGIL
jgi:NitT/TauT family transport system permease protein